MAPVVPTYRPIVTPERAAIAVAVAAVACSLFLAFNGARAESAPERASLACVEHAAALGWPESWSEPQAHPLRPQ